jgi:hypothetical protein
VPVLLAAGWCVGFAGMGLLRLSLWLLRALWGLTWRALALAAALAVVAFYRPLAWRLLALALSASVVRHLGGMGGRGLSGQRTTRSTTSPSAPAPVVKLRPVSAQRVATASYAETRFFTQALGGPGLLDMLVGPAGVGKSEIVWGSIRAGHDGEDFCGLKTTKARRILLLSEMGGETLAPALRRWGLYAEPAGRLDAVRLRLLLPRGHVGRLIDVVYSADIYKPVVVDGELRQVEWPAVIEAVRPLVEKGGYERVIVDSLGEWLGSDNNDNMLKTLTACRQLTHAGAGVTLLHHTPRTDPKRPRGGTAIEAKLDTGYYVVGTAAGGMPRSRQDPVRELGWFKTRFPDLTPVGSLALERTWAGPESGQLPRYQIRGTGAAPAVVTVSQGAGEGQESPRSMNEAKVLAAMRAAGRRGVSTTQLAAATGLPRQRAHEAVVALIEAAAAKVGGFGEPPPGGGKAPSLYVAVDAPAASPQAHQDAPGGHLRLVAPPAPNEGEDVA